MKQQIENINKVIQLLQGEYSGSSMRKYCIDSINSKIKNYMKSKKVRYIDAEDKLLDIIQKYYK